MLSEKEIEKQRIRLRPYIDYVAKKLYIEKLMKMEGYPNEYFQKFDRCRDN